VQSEGKDDDKGGKSHDGQEHDGEVQHLEHKDQSFLSCEDLIQSLITGDEVTTYLWLG